MIKTDLCTNTSNIITLTSRYQDGLKIYLLLGNFIFWVKKVQKWKTNAYYLHRISFLMSDSHTPGQEPAKLTHSGKVRTFSYSQIISPLVISIIFDKKSVGWLKIRIRSGHGMT